MNTTDAHRAPRATVRVGLGPAGLPAVRSADDRDALMDYAQRAERAGYVSICVGDHLDDRGAPLLMLTAVAMCTERLGLASHVLCNEFRNKAVLAHEAKTLSAISRGRLELGLGTGWLERDFALAGVAMRPFRDRLRTLEEAVETVRASVGESGGSLTITLGGGGDQMLRFAARLADVVTINIPLQSGVGFATNTVANGTLDAFARRVDMVRAAASDVGRDVELHAYVHQVHLGESWEVDAQAAAQKLGLPVEEYLASPHVLAGDVDGVIERISSRRDRFGLDYFSIPGVYLDAFTPVVAALS